LKEFWVFGSLECPKVLLVWWHMALPIFSGGVGLITMEVIVLSTYLGNHALVVLVIVSKFLLDFHPFLLEVIGSSGPLLFQVHLKSTQQFLPFGVITCAPFLNIWLKKL
jgi:hypothetical protein